jgi:hypothetical protein
LTLLVVAVSGYGGSFVVLGTVIGAAMLRELRVSEVRYPAVMEVLGRAVITQVAAVITPNAYSTEFSRRNRTTSLISSAPSSN